MRVRTALRAARGDPRAERVGIERPRISAGRRHTMFPLWSRVQEGDDAMAPCPVCFEKLRRSSLHSSAISALNLARAAACVLTAAGSLVVAVAPATAADTAIYKC